MKFFRWQKGRQRTGYEKMPLLILQWPLKFDCYLLRFSEGNEIPPHIDEVKQGRHFRLNLILKHARSGGEFFCEQTIFESRSIKLFRPDINKHSVSKVLLGKRYVLSVGCALSELKP